MTKISNIELPHKLIMAPMCDITHLAFRKTARRYGLGLSFTQMVSAKALIMGDDKSRHLLSYEENERPIGFQVFGNNAKDLAEAAKICEDMGPDLLDLNMGCPAKKIVNDGGGSALLNNTKLATEIFEKMRSNLKIPFTVKMRAGWDKNHKQSVEIAKIAEASGVDAVTLHARTRAQAYEGQANWDLIKELKSEIKIPVIGNGDIKTFEDINRMINETGCDAVMTGRTAISKPWFFKSYLHQEDFEPENQELKNLIHDQYIYFFDFFGKDRGLKQMRKFLCSYTKGIRNGSQFRKDILQLEDWGQIQSRINDFFDS